MTMENASLKKKNKKLENDLKEEKEKTKIVDQIMGQLNQTQAELRTLKGETNGYIYEEHNLEKILPPTFTQNHNSNYYGSPKNTIGNGNVYGSNFYGETEDVNGFHFGRDLLQASESGKPAGRRIGMKDEEWRAVRPAR